MVIKKSQLYSTLLGSYNDLRGRMDASQYKDYVLMVLSLKYHSDEIYDRCFSNFWIMLVSSCSSVHSVICAVFPSCLQKSFSIPNFKSLNNANCFITATSLACFI